MIDYTVWEPGCGGDDYGCITVDLVFDGASREAVRFFVDGDANEADFEIFGCFEVGCVCTVCDDHFRIGYALGGSHIISGCLFF